MDGLPTAVGGQSRSPVPMVILGSLTLGVTPAEALAPSSDTQVQAVSAAEPTFTVALAPYVTGSAKVGETLTANVRAYTSAAETVTYQWAVGGVSVAGAIGRTYQPRAEDLGKTVTVTVTATHSGYSSVIRTSPVTSKVTAGTLVSSKPIVFGDPPFAGTELSVSSVWQVQPDAQAYRWIVGGRTVSGATGPTYTPTAADAGKRITAVITGTRAGYSPLTVSSKPADPVETFGSISGILGLQDGTPSPMGNVELWYAYQPGDEAGAVTDIAFVQNGAYEFPRVKPGTYTLRFVTEEGNPDAYEFYGNTDEWRDAKTFTVLSGGSTSVSFTMPPTD